MNQETVTKPNKYKDKINKRPKPPPRHLTYSINPIVDIIVVMSNGELSRKEVKSIIDHYFLCIRT